MLIKVKLCFLLKIKFDDMIAFRKRGHSGVIRPCSLEQLDGLNRMIFTPPRHVLPSSWVREEMRLYCHHRFVILHTSLEKRSLRFDNCALKTF